MGFKSTVYKSYFYGIEMKKGKKYQRGLADEDFYYTKEGFLVFTEKYHLKRGYCCKSGCRHCPYGFKRQ